MKSYKLFGIALVLLPALGSCELPYAATRGDLASRSLSYLSGDHAKIQVVFDSSGTAGSYEESTEVLEPITQTLLKTTGTRGTFTYRPDTNTAVVKVDEVYAPSPGAIYVSNGIYSQYAWQDLVTLYASCAPGLSSYSVTYSGTAIITRDHFFLPGLAGSDRKVLVYTGGNLWTNTMQTTTSATRSGSTTTIVEERSRSKTIGAATMSLVTNDVFTYTSASGMVRTSTQSNKYDYAIRMWHSSSPVTGEATFAELWKAGNTVSLDLERLKYEDTYYDDASSADTPAIEPATGTGGNREGSPRYYQDLKKMDVSETYSYLSWDAPQGQVDYMVDLSAKSD